MSSVTSTHSTGRSVRYAVGAALLVGGAVGVVWGFATFTGSALDGSGSGPGRSMALFAGGGLAAVLGFGLVAFTRAGDLTRRGAHTRITDEQGLGAARAPAGAAAGPHCTSCGAAVAPDDRFCGSCGAALAGAVRR